MLKSYMRRMLKLRPKDLELIPLFGSSHFWSFLKPTDVFASLQKQLSVST